ncbi:MAG: sigma-70 family RNA polymerase sigma factor [Elusimicrobia bacterium]|nr:sigma-70 family RNA polymerase sigma factor [Elusimicrobiota bacterium]
MDGIRELVQRARDGDSRALAAIVRSYEAMVFHLAFGILRDARDAEEAAQDAFLRAFRALDRFDLSRPFGPWIAKIAVNLALNRLRSRPADLPLESAAEVQDQGPGPEAMADQTAERDAVRKGLDELGPADREVLALKYEGGLKVSEIAGSLGIGLAAAKVRLFRARQRLMEILRRRPKE